MTLLFVVLRFIHIVAGVIWAGGVVMISAFIMPSIMAAGPSGQAVMKQMVQLRKMPARLLGLALATVVAGLLMYWIDTRDSLGAFPRSAFGMGIGAGAVAAIVAVIIGAFVSKPTADRLGALGAELANRGGPPTEAEAAEIARLQGKLRGAARAVAVLVVIAAAFMAVSRYL